LWDFVRTYALLTNLTTLCELSDHCTNTLKGAALTTVFAPTDSAFKKLPVQTRAELWKPSSTTFRNKFLLRHLVFGDILSTALKPAQDLETLDGTMLHVTRTSTSAGDVIRVQGNSTVTRKDLIAVNGVLDTIDTCILPSSSPTPKPAPPSPAVPTPPAPSPVQTFTCVKGQCTSAPGGLNKSACERFCG
jgi:uncharacterized surface protein with fasciclin (FAS1) repeats